MRSSRAVAREFERASLLVLGGSEATGSTHLAPAAVVEFLGSLQALPPGTNSRIVDEHYRPKRWSGP